MRTVEFLVLDEAYASIQTGCARVLTRLSQIAKRVHNGASTWFLAQNLYEHELIAGAAIVSGSRQTSGTCEI